MITNKITVTTSEGETTVRVYGKVTEQTVRQLLRRTIKERTKNDKTLTPYGRAILDNNFIVNSVNTDTTMYECDVHDFVKIAKPIKRIH